MIELSVIRDFVAIFGVIAGFSYYVLTVRATNRNRRIQLITNLMTGLLSFEGIRRGEELLSLEWKDYDDFDEKYGNDLDLSASRYTIFGTYDRIGWLVMDNELDLKTTYNMYGLGVISFWVKYEPIIRELRVRFNGSDWLEGFEYLAGEMMKIKRQKSPGYVVPDAFYKMSQSTA